MKTLVAFLYKRREPAIFIVLELLSFWLIVVYNRRYNVSFLNSNNAVIARINQGSAAVSDYFELKAVNEQLMAENARLQDEIRKWKSTPNAFKDSIGSYVVTGARVIDNSFRRSANYLTVSVGKNMNIEPGMGVITGAGIVGQVKSVSQNYATIYSILHPNVLVSSKVKRTSTTCTVQWNPPDYRSSMVKYIPRHIQLNIGDTVVTSGYNSVFPEDLVIGYIESLDLEDHMTFYRARLKLSVDFTSLPYVYIMESKGKMEKDSLERL